MGRLRPLTRPPGSACTVLLWALLALARAGAGVGGRGEGVVEGWGGCRIWTDIGLAQPREEDSDSTGSLWVLDGGVPGPDPPHWSQGLDLAVVEGGADAAPSLLIGGDCPLELTGRCAFSVVQGGFVLGGGERLEECPKETRWAEGPYEIRLEGLLDGVYNLTVELGPPCSYVGHVAFARVQPPIDLSLEVAFPPGGYEFGSDVKPFLLMHVHMGTAKHTQVYARLRTLNLESGQELVTGDFWDFHGHRVHVQGAESPGRYECGITLLDVLKRPILGEKRVTFAVSPELSERTCISGNSNCRPQTAPSGAAVLADTSLNASRLLARCPPPTARGFTCEGCSGHGTCALGACVCTPDWIGERCEHHTLSGLRFLPEVHPAERVTRCEQTAILERGSEALASRIDDLQFPQTCNPLFQRFNKTQGLGVTLRWIALSLTASVSRGQTLVVGGRWRAFNFEGCAEKGAWCFFQRITNCSVTVWDWERVAAEDFLMPGVLGIPFPGVEQGQLWWVAAMTRAAVQPSLSMDTRLRRLRNELGWPSSRILGLHVRHGDSCADRTRNGCVPAEKFFEEAEGAARKYGMRDIFLATDDQDVVEASRTREGFRYMAVEMDRRALFSSNMYIEHRIEMGTVDRKGVSEATFTDLFLLSECDALVGSFGSHFSKTAYELMVANKGDFMPYVSVDRPWEPLRPVVPYGALAARPTWS